MIEVYTETIVRPLEPLFCENETYSLLYNNYDKTDGMFYVFPSKFRICSSDIDGFKGDIYCSSLMMRLTAVFLMKFFQFITYSIEVNVCNR